MNADDANRPLPVLRALIDAIDRDVLQLLARRTALVGEIGAHKREHGLAIRDVEREREVLGERLGRARELGLPEGVVESIWRQVLLASRDHQAALRAEVPPDEPMRTVALLGGEGGMGRLFRRLFADLGHAVLNVDLHTDLSAVEAARVADVVVVSVPIRETEAVIREVGPHLSADALLMDLTSLKSLPLRAMLESTKASVVGTHPMFGPDVHTLQGQRVVVCAGRGDEWLGWVRRSMKSRGLEVVDAEATEHDRVMALVQVLNHFRTQVLGLTLARAGTSLERTLAFTSPAYLLEAYVTGRHFAQAPALYGPIEMLNPHQAEVTDLFRACATEISGILARGEQPAFDALFEEVRGFFGDFTEEALSQSGFLLDRLVELTAGRAAGDRK